DKESIDLFASAKSYYDDLIERTFLLWVKHIKNADEDYSVSSFEISGNLIYIDARYYRGCNEYDNDSFKMHIEYIISYIPEQLIKDEAARIATEKAQAEAIRQETLRQQKILDDAERQRQQDQRDREEFQRLSKKFGNND
ncbi:MAG: hypothetical protein RSG77_22615, partial [Hafnia sp.]